MRAIFRREARILRGFLGIVALWALCWVAVLGGVWVVLWAAWRGALG